MESIKNNLNTFRTLYLVKGILTLCFSIFFILYGLFGYFFINSIEVSESTDGMPFSPDLFFFSSFGIIIMVIAAIGIIASIIIGALTLLASKYIKATKNYNFIFVMAIVNCLTGILGIVLGIFTLIELSKPEIKKLFNKV